MSYDNPEQFDQIDMRLHRLLGDTELLIRLAAITPCEAWQLIVVPRSLVEKTCESITDHELSQGDMLLDYRKQFRAYLDAQKVNKAI